MDDATLRRRLWEGFAGLQTLLGGNARQGRVMHLDGLVASVVPSAPDSPALNAVVALEPAAAPFALQDLADEYASAGVRRWAIWIDGGAWDITAELRRSGLAVASAAPGMGAEIGRLDLDLSLAHPEAGPRPQNGGPGNRPPLRHARGPPGRTAAPPP